MAASCILAHDAGTYSSKTLLLDPLRGVLARSQQYYAPRLARGGRAEQPPDEWWSALTAATHEMLRSAGIERRRVEAIVFTGQMLGIVPVSRDSALGEAIVWPDARAQHEAASLARRLGGKAVCRALFGAPPSAKDVVPKLLWLRRNDASRWRRTRWLLDVPGYLAWRASGVAAIDWSCASATGLLDRRSRGWNRLVARYAGVPVELLPPTATPGARIGALQPAAAAALGLLAGTPVLCGAGDAVAAAWGSGADGLGAGQLYLGTSGWISTVAATPGRGAPALHGCRAGRFHRILQSESVGACLDWIAEVLCCTDGDRAFQEVEALAAAARSGAGGTLFHPYLWGERAPLDDANARAAFSGIGAGTGRAELARAVWEGVALNVRRLAEQLRKAGTLPHRVRACGGAARSDLLLQLIADTSGLELERVTDPTDTVALGAALIAAGGLGVAVDRGVITVDRIFRASGRE